MSEPKQTAPQKSRSVFIYLAILFAAAFLLLLLAYFIQQRNYETDFDALNQANALTKKQLVEENQGLKDQLEELQTQVDELQSEKAQLETTVADQAEALADLKDQSTTAEFAALLFLAQQYYDQQDYETSARLMDFLAAHYPVTEEIAFSPAGLTDEEGLSGYEIWVGYATMASALAQQGYLDEAGRLLPDTTEEDT